MFPVPSLKLAPRMSDFSIPQKENWRKNIYELEKKNHG